MSVEEVGFDHPVRWPSNGISEVPFRLYTDPEQYRLEQERIFKGPTWNYLCLTAEIPEPGSPLRHLLPGTERQFPQPVPQLGFQGAAMRLGLGFQLGHDPIVYVSDAKLGHEKLL